MTYQTLKPCKGKLVKSFDDINDAEIEAKPAAKSNSAPEFSPKADIELQPLSAINTVLERLEKGQVPGRVVLDFTEPKSGAALKPAREAVPA